MAVPRAIVLLAMVVPVPDIVPPVQVSGPLTVTVPEPLTVPPVCRERRVRGGCVEAHLAAADERRAGDVYVPSTVTVAPVKLTVPVPVIDEPAGAVYVPTAESEVGRRRPSCIAAPEMVPPWRLSMLEEASIVPVSVIGTATTLVPVPPVLRGFLR